MASSKRCFTEYIRWVLMKQSCRGMPFNLITETEKSSKKHHETSTIFVIRLFCIKNFSSGVFLSFIHDFRRLYPKKLWIQPERATRKSREPYRWGVIILLRLACVPFTLRHCAWVRQYRSVVAESFGYVVNCQGTRIIQQLFGLNRLLE